MSSAVAPLIEIEAITGVAPDAEVAPRVVALTRTLVMRYTRDTPLETGGSTGIPNNVTWLLPGVTMPWKTFAPNVVEVVVQTLPVNVVQESTAVPRVGPAWFPTYSMQPVVGVWQTF